MINLVKISKSAAFRIVLILFWFVFSFSAGADANTIDDNIVRLIQSVQKLPLQQRIIQSSATFIDKPYQLEPLGEGAIGEFNQNPLYRLDVFDCETYVDTVMALVLSNNLQQFQGLINRIRYHNEEISFETRNHFTSADWIPNNQRFGVIKDLTAEIAGKDSRVSQVYINRKNWYRHLSLSRIVRPDLNDLQHEEKWQQLRSLSKMAVNSTANIDYIPLDFLLREQRVIKKIPDGAIIFLVLTNPKSKMVAGTQNNISHMGFAIWKNEQLYLRAASIIGNRVIDLPLLSYLKKYSSDTGLQGISVWMVTRPQLSYSQVKSNQLE